MSRGQYLLGIPNLKHVLRERTMDGAGCEWSERTYKKVGGRLAVTRFIMLNNLL